MPTSLSRRAVVLHACSLCLLLFATLLPWPAAAAPRRASTQAEPAQQLPPPADREDPTYAGSNLEWVGQIGGSYSAAEIIGDVAYIGVGTRLMTLDTSGGIYTELDSVMLPGVVSAISVAGGRAYVATDTREVWAVDIGRPRRLRILGGVALPSHIMQLAAARDSVYVASGDGVHLLNFATPERPVLIFTDPRYAGSDIRLTDEYLLVRDGNGIAILQLPKSSTGETLTLAGSVPLYGYPTAFSTSGDRLYVVAKDVLYIVDISNPAAPIGLGLHSLGAGQAQTEHDAVPRFDLAVAGDLLLASDDDGILRAFDVADPTAVALLWTEDIGVGGAKIASVAGSVIYLVDWNSGLWAFDIAQPEAPGSVRRYWLPSYDLQDVLLVDGYAYTSGPWLALFDVRDPGAPHEVTLPRLIRARQLLRSNSLLLTVGGDEGVAILDVSNPAAPAEIGHFTAITDAHEAAVGGAVLAVADRDYGVRIVDITDPTAPIQVGLIYLGEELKVRSLSLQASLLAISVADRGVYLYDVSDPAKPSRVGYHRNNWGGQVRFAGPHLYVDAAFDFQVLDVSDPAEISVVRHEDRELSGLLGVGAANRLLFGLDADTGWELQVVNAQSPTGYRLVAEQNLPGSSIAAAADGDLIAVAAGGAGLLLLRVQDLAAEGALLTTPQAAPPAPVLPDEDPYARNIYVREIGAISGITGDSPLLDPSDQSYYRYIQEGRRRIERDGYLIYLLAYGWGLRIIDAEDPYQPRVLADLPVPGRPVGLRVHAGRAYVISLKTDLIETLYTVDVSDPANPLLLNPEGAMNISCGDLAVQGTRLYTWCDRGVVVFDAADPLHVAPVGNTIDATSPANARTLEIVDNMLYVLADGFAVYDLGQEGTPKLLNSVDFGYEWYEDMIVAEDNIYLIGSSDMRILDRATLASISTTEFWSPVDIFVRGRYAFVAGFPESIWIWDVSDPENTVDVAHVGTNSFDLETIHYDSEVAYAGSLDGGLRIYQIGGSSTSPARAPQKVSPDQFAGMTTTAGLESLAGWIVFASSRDYKLEDDYTASYGPHELFALNPATGDILRITAKDGVSTSGEHIAVSPDGTRILLTGYTDLPVREIGLDGQIVRNISHPGDWAAPLDWSADGSKVLFSVIFAGANGPEEQNLYSMDVASGEFTQLSDNQPRDYLGNWSPDGARIAVSRNYELWTLNSDGSNAVKLIEQPARDLAWSPDGQTIAFEGLADEQGTVGGYDWRIWLVDADGGSPHKAPQSSGLREMNPDWSADGKMIVYSVTFPPQDVYQLFIVDVATGERKQMTQTGDNSFPEWVPGPAPDFAAVRPAAEVGDTEVSDVEVTDADASEAEAIEAPAASTPRAVSAPGAAAPSAGDALVDGYVKEGPLNLRSGPSTADGVMTQLAENTPLQIVARSADGAWLRVEVGGLSGWVAAPYVTEGFPEAEHSTSATASASAQPACLSQPSALLAELYVWEQLGCVRSASVVTWAAWQPFDGGDLLWRADTDEVYVFYGSGSWSPIAERWNGEAARDRGAPPAGRQAPLRGFGWLWGLRDDLFAQLGWAVHEEMGFCVEIQPTERGFMLRPVPEASCGGQQNRAGESGFTLRGMRVLSDGDWLR